MLNDIIDQSKEVAEELRKIEKFQNNFRVTPFKKVTELYHRINELEHALTETPEPITQEQLYESELKRKIRGVRISLESSINPRSQDFNDVVTQLGIPQEDIENIKPWLQKHREEVIDSIQRLYESNNIESYELGLSVDIPHIKRQAEEVVASKIQQYHKILGNYIKELTEIGDFLRDIDAVATTEERSYFNSLTNILAIGIPAVAYMNEEGSILVREKNLIRLYGHEGMGHGLHFTITKSAQLPYFLKEHGTNSRPTKESIAQYYEKQIFEDLKNSPDTQKKLGIHHAFKEIYQSNNDFELIDKYKQYMEYYAFSVLADKSLGNHDDPQAIQKKRELLEEVGIYPGYGQSIIERYRYHYDTQGNFDSGKIYELIYCAQPVERALQEFEKAGLTYQENRSLIDKTLLTGIWTAQGFVDNARLVAQQHKK